MAKNLSLIAAALFAWPAASQQVCENLASLKLDHTSITSALTVPAAPNIPAHCAVKAVTRPTTDSEIQFELWLPLTGWNGKYQQVGNGGWAGDIPVGALAEPLRRGYAVAGTDDGHSGGGAEWSIGHPEKLADFGYRAVHETRLHAAAITRAFYGKETTRHYFVGCSDGGREALMEAQRYADDFDGIIAGAPANNWTHILTAALWFEHALLGDPAATIPQSKLPIIQKAAVDQCDALDGAKDGLIEDPRVCHVNVAAITCKGIDRVDCLTAPQAAALKKIYGGPVNPRTGQQLHPGATPGVEAVRTTWSDWIIPNGTREPALFGFANTFFLQAVYQNQKTDFRTLNFDSDVAYANEKTAHILNSMNPDLAPFRAHGGKLIQYHGWGDAAIPGQDSIDYYELVRKQMGTGVDDFYRLFMVPGMSHCSGGLGANTFGNGNTVAGAKEDPEQDLLAALDRWVEKGTAPAHFIGTGKSVIEPEKVLTRPICAYPKVARYKGSGDMNSAANFSCYPAN